MSAVIITQRAVDDGGDDHDDAAEGEDEERAEHNGFFWLHPLSLGSPGSTCKFGVQHAQVGFRDANFVAGSAGQHAKVGFRDANGWGRGTIVYKQIAKYKQ